ncbi:hypothetical protein FRC12_021154 [Ceratobasidium sp. 428]|nr:hypothetical protein FRC12_021154 [Ceratobasidium sp. 428]
MVATLSPTAAAEASDRKTSLERGVSQRPEMEVLIQHEIALSVYQYPQFLEEFFSFDDQGQHDKISALLASDPLFNHLDQPWSIDCDHLEQVENDAMHETVASILNTIGQAAFRPDQLRPVYQQIVASRNRPISADDPNDTNTVPDLVQARPGPRNRRHWAEVQFVVECKGKNATKTPTEQISDALLQLARYARATLIHQIHRLHVFSIAVVGTQAIFVRLDRNGILHSKPIDLVKNFREFALAAAGLFALNPDSFGYDTRFYFWPPLTGTPDDHNTPREFRVKTDKKRWTVLETICQRKCLVGRATLVLRLSRITNRQERAVLKTIWRNKSRTDEGKNLAYFHGSPGICQSRWSFIGPSTAVHNPGSMEDSPYMIRFYPPLPRHKADQIRKEATSQQSGNYLVGLARRGQCREARSEDREYSLILMDEGVGLCQIKRLPHLFRVLRDGLIGLAKIAEEGKVHRDISEGNILCSPPDNKPSTSAIESSADVKEDLDTASQAVVAFSFIDGHADAYSGATTDADWYEALPDSAGPVIISANTYEEYVQVRYQGSQWCAGRLHDLEFMADQIQLEGEKGRAALTGTPAFISAQLLDPFPPEPVTHSFLHDLESVFWVLVWVVATHKGPRAKLSPQAEQIIDQLCSREDATLGAFKLNFFGLPKRSASNIQRLGNGWEAAEPVIHSFAVLLKRHIYPEGEDKGNSLGSWAVFKEAIDIFDRSISPQAHS